MAGFETRTGSSGSLRFIPFAVIVIFILLDGLPAMSGWLMHLELGLFFIPLFYIGLHAERDYTPVGVLALGLFNDVLSDAPIGFWGILFCVLYMLGVSQRAVLQNARWGSYWTSFIVVVSVTYLVGYLIALMRDDMSIGGGVYFLSAMVTALCFPMIYFPLGWLQSEGLGRFTFGEGD